MIVLAHKYGQLGNRLFYLRSFLALAMEYNLKLAIFSFDEYARFFSGTIGGAVPGYPPRQGSFLPGRWTSRIIFLLLNRLPGLISFLDGKLGLTLARPADGRFLFDEDGVEILRREGAVLLLSGWPCVPPKILDKHAESIRAYFALTGDCLTRVQHFVADARESGDHLVGIHLRQGDYKTWNDGQHYFAIDVYVALMKKVVEKYHDRKVVFIICTNEDQDWTLFEEFSYARGPGDAVADMYSLAGCDEIYGPKSSFSAWAAFYGRRPLFNLEEQHDLFSAGSPLTTG